MHYNYFSGMYYSAHVQIAAAEHRLHGTLHAHEGATQTPNTSTK
ncbi:hypothetical protein PULV_b0314 [Pseudoalteromonas ulvae UL12]|nr:hypothetical protein [Pseudoalteromonas ulvae UL12]